MHRGYGPFLVPGLALVALVVGLPFLTNVAVSFTRWTGVGWPRWAGLANYRRAFADATFWASFENNLVLLLAVTVIPTLLGLVLAVLLYDTVARRFGARPVAALKAGLYVPQVLPVAVAGIVWGWILDPGGGALNAALHAVGLGRFAGNWLGDPDTALPSIMGIMVWFQLGYPLVIFMAAVQRIDPQLLEAAELDGARWHHRFHLVSHLVRPELLVVVLTTTIYALKLFGPIYVLTRGGPGNATIVPSYFAYQNFFEKARVGYGAAISTLMTLIILVLTALFIRAQHRQERALEGR
ncbi:MAG TPA: sugar ABC transporter permease [Anaeromyxobacter sp.]|nr:sugar ABC transporter permease [Anaeromyxobacter sp.]